IGQGFGDHQPAEGQLGSYDQGTDQQADQPAHESDQQPLNKIDPAQFPKGGPQTVQCFGVLLLVQDHHDDGPDHIEQGDYQNQGEDEVGGQVFGIEHFVKGDVLLLSAQQFHLVPQDSAYGLSDRFDQLGIRQFEIDPRYGGGVLFQ